MRFVLLNQFYPPDVAPTGRVLHDLAQVLAARGHAVRVLASQRSYDGGQGYPARAMLDGVEVERLAAMGFGRRGFLGKLCDYLSFYCLAAAKLRFQSHPPDGIIALTTPPYIGLLAKFAAARYGCRHVHWVMDLYPDVMVAHGMVRDQGLIHRRLQALTRYELKHASQILALGPFMARKVAQYTREPDCSQVHPPLTATIPFVPPWSDPSLAPWPEEIPIPLRVQRRWDNSELVLQYSGNIGLGHRFQEFFAAAERLGQNGPRWVFAGGGKRRAEVAAFIDGHQQARVELLPYVEPLQLGEHLCAADVHLVSLDSAWQGLMVPSKLQSSFAVARPVIFVGGQHNEMAAWIKESGGGWVVGENDVNGMLDAVAEAKNRDERRRRGQAATAYAREHFRMSLNCARIAELLERG